MDRYLHHVSLNTGLLHRSERGAVPNSHLCASLLAEAMAGNPPVVPGTTPPIMLHRKDEGHCISIWFCKANAPDDPPIVRIAIAATQSERGAELWRTLHTNAPIMLATLNEVCPPAPWCAERLDAEPPRVDADVWGTLQHFERSLAWAFIELRRVENGA